MMKKHGQLHLILTNNLISRIFCKIFARICFRKWYILTFFAELYFREKGKKSRNSRELILQIINLKLLFYYICYIFSEMFVEIKFIIYNQS